jgi:hypothetical protein
MIGSLSCGGIIISAKSVVNDSIIELRVLEIRGISISFEISNARIERSLIWSVNKVQG